METTESRHYPAVDAACLKFKEFLQSVEPSPEVREHFRSARLEVLRGLRRIIDNRIEELTRKSETGHKIEVE